MKLPAQNEHSSLATREGQQISRRALVQASIGGALVIAGATGAAFAQVSNVAPPATVPSPTPKPGNAVSPANRNVFVPHGYPEQKVNLGEISMNYAVTGSADKPALLLVPGQTGSWWGYERAMAILEKDFQVYSVDLRGQGRTDWTPRRYTLDNMGNDLVRFIALAIKRPVIVSGNSSGGLLAAWLSAYSMPGQIRAAHFQDPPFFASETEPSFGHSIHQAAGPRIGRQARHLGDQWSIGDWQGLQGQRALETDPRERRPASEPPQNIKEYDPEWGRAFVEGTVAKSCPHDRMLAQVKTPVLFTHHARRIDSANGFLIGAISDFQVAKVREIVTKAGQPFEYVDAPDAAHAMHVADPERFSKILGDWAKKVKV